MHRIDSGHKFATPAGQQTMPVVDGVAINVSESSEAVTAILAQLEHGASFMVCTLNLYHLVKRARDVAFRNAYDTAKIVTADGFPIVMLVRLQGMRCERTAGSDLLGPLCRAAASRGYPIFLLGSTFPTLAKASVQLADAYPGLNIAGIYAPPFGLDAQSTEVEEMFSMVQLSGARLCFLALSAPAQEILGARGVTLTGGIAFLGFGAALDFVAGTQKRSPRVLRQMNLEWAWRLALEPRRLWRRYFDCAIIFLRLLARHFGHIARGGGQRAVQKR